MAKTVFFSYSHKDEPLRDLLADHLSLMIRQGEVTAWYDREISAGDEWKDKIDEHLNNADIILLLVSANFLASDYCYDVEMNLAMQRHKTGDARVIPIILKPVDWSNAPFSKLQTLPKNSKPITSWKNMDEAMLSVARGIRQAIDGIELLTPNPQPALFQQSSDESEIPPDEWFKKKRSRVGRFIGSLFDDT